MLVEFGSESDHAVDRDLYGHVIVWNILFRVCEAFSDHLPNLTVVFVFKVTCIVE